MSVLKNKKLKVFLLVFTIMVLGFKFNIAFLLGEGEREEICPTSEILMVSNLHYFQMGNNDNFVKHQSNLSEEDMIYQDYFMNDKTVQKDFVRYTSSLCLHRYIYYGILKVTQNPLNALQLMHGFNILMLSLVISIIMLWLSQYSSLNTVLIVSSILALGSPGLFMAGKNLYWAIWNLFIPMIGSILLIEFKNGKKLSLKTCFTVSLISCIVKQMFYYEFVTVAMVAMTVPYIFWFIFSEKDKKDVLKYFCTMILAAILSFVITSVIKLILLRDYYADWQETLSVLINPVIYRIVGDPSDLNPVVVDSANVSFISVLLIMFRKTAVSLKYIIFISQGGTLIIYLIYVILGFWKRRENEILGIKNKLYYAWILTIGLSLFAPLSWFVLGKPHTYIHNVQCSVVWWCPFAILLYCFFTFTVISRRGK